MANWVKLTKGWVNLDHVEKVWTREGGEWVFFTSGNSEVLGMKADRDKLIAALEQLNG